MRSFAEYVERDWGTHKRLSLLEASMAYKGSQHQSKSPVLYDQDDWKFLIQFPPDLQTAALHWRWNKGLLLASKLRHEDPDLDDDAIPNYVDKIAFKKGGGPESQVRYVVTSDKTQKHGRKGLYVGLRDLVQKLEKRIKYHQHHTGPGVKEGPGIREVDVFAKNPEDVKHYPDKEGEDGKPEQHFHRDEYLKNHGVYDFDLTNPVEMDHEEARQEAIEKLRARGVKDPEKSPLLHKVMKDLPLSFAGFSVMRHQTASNSMNNWIKANATKLLGQVGDTVKDPYTGEELPVEHDVNPKELNPRWASHIGGGTSRSAAGSEPSPNQTRLGIPTVKRHIKMYRVEPGKKPKDLSGDYRVPVLLPGKLLPRLELNSEQRAEIARRTQGRKKGEEDTRGLRGLKHHEQEALSTEKRREGQIEELQRLFSNWDQLTEEQKEKLVKDQRDLLHFIAFDHDKAGYLRKYKDPYASDHYVAGGFTPMKAQRKTTPLDLPPDQVKKAIDEYYPFDSEHLKPTPVHLKKHGTFRTDLGGGLLGDAMAGVDYFLHWAQKSGQIPESALQMVDRQKADIAELAAVLLGLNLNDPNMGVRNEELGFTALHPNTDPERARERRVHYAFNFAKDLSQAALDDMSVSRRKRGKGAKHQSMDKTNPSGEGTFGSGVSYSSDEEREVRRKQLAAGGDDQKHFWHNRPGVAGSQWITPNIPGFTDHLLSTWRNKILNKVGGDTKYVAALDRINEQMTRAAEVMQELLAGAKQELAKSGLTGMALEDKAHETASAQLEEELKKRHPDLFQGAQQRNMHMVKAQVTAREQGSGAQEAEYSKRQEEQDELTKKHQKMLEDLIEFGRGEFYGWQSERMGGIPELVKMRDMTVDQLKSATPLAVVSLIQKMMKLGEEDVRAYGPRLIQKIAEANRKPITLAQAGELLKQAGVDPGPMPQQAVAPAPTPTQSQPQPATPFRQAAKSTADLTADPVRNWKQVVDPKSGFSRQQLAQALQQAQAAYQKAMANQDHDAYMKAMRASQQIRAYMNRVAI